MKFTTPKVPYSTYLPFDPTSLSWVVEIDSTVGIRSKECPVFSFRPKLYFTTKRAAKAFIRQLARGSRKETA